MSEAVSTSAARRFSKRRVVLAVVGVAMLVLGYYVWTLLPTTIRVRGDDPRILIGSVYSAPALQLMGQVAYNDGCIYMIRVHPLTRDVLGHNDAVWPRSARPVVIGGVPGVEMGEELFLVGDYFLAGGREGTYRPATTPTPTCRPPAEGMAVLRDLEPADP